MYSRNKAQWSTAVLVLIVGVSITGGLLISGCGNTDGGDGALETFVDDAFVSSDSATGSLSLEAPDSIAVGGVDSFSVKVRDVDGSPVPQLKISCDSERGVAIIEPTTGTEITDQYGGISGVIGCRFPGSFQFGCRLPVGGNKRKFATIHCEGDIPAGFNGFPNAAGGGLGTGGVSVNPDGTEGGADISGVRITTLSVFDVSDSATFGIDIVQNNDCNADGTSDDPEPFVQNLVKATIENNSNQAVRVTSMRFVVSNVDGSGSGSYTSPATNLNGEADANGGTFQATVPFTTFTGSGKAFIGRTTTINSLFRNITFRFTIRNESGETATINSSIGVDFQNFDNCG